VLLRRGSGDLFLIIASENGKRSKVKLLVINSKPIGNVRKSKNTLRPRQDMHML